MNEKCKLNNNNKVNYRLQNMNPSTVICLGRGDEYLNCSRNTWPLWWSRLILPAQRLFRERAK